MSYANALKKARLRAGWSQAKVAEKVGVTPNAVCAWEAGRACPAEKNARMIKRFLGVSSGGDPPEPPPETSAFGAWLRRAREDAHMSVQELSEESGVSLVGIYNIEQGKSLNPRTETKVKLANALKLDIPKDVQREDEKAQEIEGVGILTDFDPLEPKDWPSDPGVYILYDVTERPVYVGESQEIAARMRQHRADKFWFNYPIVATASYIKIRGRDERLKVEKLLIKFLKSNAVINKRHVDY